MAKEENLDIFEKVVTANKLVIDLALAIEDLELDLSRKELEGSALAIGGNRVTLKLITSLYFSF